MSCPYRDILGRVGTGAHSYRVFDFAIVDILLTILGAYLIQRFLLPTFSFALVLLGLFLLGIVLHRLFCVRTTVDKILFP
jgi:hypothetical protein